jgi:hypothetical protein
MHLRGDITLSNSSRQFVRKNIGLANLRGACQELTGTRHERSGHLTSEMRLPPSLVVESIEYCECALIKA